MSLESARKPEEIFSSNFVGNLLAAMMVGQLLGMVERAQKIKKAASKAVEDEAELDISLAFASAVGGEIAACYCGLQNLNCDTPKQEAGRLTLALGLKIAGDKTYIEIAEEVLSISSDQRNRVFAHNLLEK